MSNETRKSPSSPRPLAAVVCLLSMMTMLLAGACERRREPSGPGHQDVLARFEGGVITAGDLERYIDGMPTPLRSRHETPQGKRQALDQLLGFELLAAEAERRGLASHPEVVRGRKQQLIAVMMKTGGPAASTAQSQQNEAAARSYYQAHYSEFHQEPQRRVVDVAFAGSTGSRKALALRSAEIRRAQQAVADAAAGDRLSRSDALVKSWVEAGHARAGDLGFVSPSSSALPAPLVAAAARLEHPGQLSEVVEVDGALHVLQLKEVRPGFSRPFTAVKRQIQERLDQTDKDQRMKGLVAQLRQRAQVQIDERALAAPQAAAPPP